MPLSASLVLNLSRMVGHFVVNMKALDPHKLGISDEAMESVSLTRCLEEEDDSAVEVL